MIDALSGSAYWNEINSFCCTCPDCDGSGVAEIYDDDGETYESIEQVPEGLRYYAEKCSRCNGSGVSCPTDEEAEAAENYWNDMF